MAPTAVRSRHRVLRETTPPASDGLVTLYSQHLPQLPPDKYEIKVVHDFGIPLPSGSTQSQSLSGFRQLEVRSPQFSLDRDAIHSVYPPPGAEISGGVLPHAVFHDPYLPWARPLAPGGGPNLPWLCLMVFDPAELIVSQDELLGPKGSRPAGGLFPSVKSETELPFSSSSYALQTTIKTLKDSISKPQTPFGDNGISTTGLDENTPVSVILPRRTVVEQLFPWNAPADQFYRYMAHARELDATSFADVLGVTDGDLTTGMSTYGVLISPRCGPIKNKLPQTVVVHVVSLESVAGIYGTAKKDSSDRVAIISLHSWSYSCTPPNSADFLDSMENLGNNLQQLRAPDKVTESLSSPPVEDPTKPPALPGDQAQKAWLAGRLEDGFTFVRHRLANGDVASGMYRSVLTPNLVPHPLRAEGGQGEAFPTASRYGTDLQIIDSQTGLADLTYNLAWELGKSLGTADKTFSAALLRVRNAIHLIGIREASQTVLAHKKAFVNREKILRALEHLPSRLNSDTVPLKDTTHPRWACGVDKCGVATERSALSFTSHAMEAALEKSIPSAASQVASNVKGTVYNETGSPKNTDWAVVLAWVMDKLFLGDIPPQYILPDPSHLPRESLRTFHIDDNWMDSFLDGALSIADRFDKHDGGIRDAIKQQINRFLQTKDEAGEYPAVPSWGFLMRSAVVGAFPNLEIKGASADGISTVPLSDSDLCIANVISEDILLCVFNRGMSTRDQYHEGFVICQPKHQQFYAVGTDVEEDQIQVTFTAPANPDSSAPSTGPGATTPSIKGLWERGGRMQVPCEEGRPASEQPVVIGGVEKVFDFDTRMIQFPGFIDTAASVNDKLFTTLPHRRPTDRGQFTAALVADLLSQPTLKMTLQDRQVAATTGELPYREILARQQALPTSSAPRAPAVSAPARRQLPVKRPQAAASAATPETAPQAAVPADSSAQSNAGPVVSPASETPARPLEVPSLHSEQFSPNFKFPDSLLDLEAENISERNWRSRDFHNSNKKALYVGIPARVYPPRAALNITPLKPAPRTVALNRLELRIPVGPAVSGGRGTLFDHTRTETTTQPPQPRVVGPRWLCNATYEVPAYNNDGVPLDPGQVWYVITVVPRVGIDSLFGWQLSEMGGIQLLLPDLHLRPAFRPVGRICMGWWGGAATMEEVIITVVQDFTWEERVAWERIGSRTEQFRIYKAVQVGPASTYT